MIFLESGLTGFLLPSGLPPFFFRQSWQEGPN